MTTRAARARRCAAAAFVAAALVPCAWAPAAAQAARPAAAPAGDPYGYVLLAPGDARCPFQFVDIRSTGDPVDLAPSGEAPAQDDGGAVVALGAPFELYGVPLETLIMSSNGYLAAAGSLDAEGGGDFSNDDVLPAVPDNEPAVAGRVMVYHGELDGLAAGATHSRYFGACPRGSGAIAGEPCSVFQWTGWSAGGEGRTLDLQAVLYHLSHSVVLQLRPLDGALTGGTIGVQDAAATAASQYRLPAGGLAGETAVCLLDPRFPYGGPVADLAAVNSDKLDGVGPGARVTWAVGAINRGPSPVVGATLQNLVPPELIDCSWSCEPSSGATCAASGQGAIVDRVDLAPGAWVDYALDCTVAPWAERVVTTASIAPPPGVTDPVAANDAANDADRVLRRSPDCRAGPSAGDGPLWPARPGDGMVACEATARGAHSSGKSVSRMRSVRAGQPPQP